MLAKLAGDSQLAGVGLPVDLAEHSARPIGEHLDDFRRHLAAKGNTAKHVAKTCNQIQAVLDHGKLASVDELTDTALADFLEALRQPSRPVIPLDPKKNEYTRAELAAVLGVNLASVARMLRRDGLAGTGQGKARRYSRETIEALQARLCRGAGVTTCNHYLTAMKAFTRWLVRKNRIPADTLAYMQRQNAETDPRHVRRALREEAFARFVEATANGLPFRGLTGADRLVLYTLAANTGFRAGELASLTPASFTLDTTPATVTASAAYSKRRHKDTQPLRADVAEMMRRYLAGRPRRQPVWPGTWSDVGADMVRHDIAAAGIPYADDDGRLFDFHAMRGQFISLLAARGVHPKVAQALARHSTITLTMDYYTHLDVFDVGRALDALPEISGQAKIGLGKHEVV